MFVKNPARRVKARSAGNKAARRGKANMKRKKLYGAAAAARAKRLAKRKRNPARRRKARKVRRNPIRRARRTHRRIRRRARRNPPMVTTHAYRAGFDKTFGAKPKRKRKSGSKSAAARKAARTRAMKKAARSAAGRKAARTRARAGASTAARPRRARKSKGKGRARKSRAKNRAYGIKSLRRARRSIKRARRKGGLAGYYARRLHMRTNPRRRRARRNPSGVIGSLKAMVMAAAPVALSLYLTRLITSKVGPMIPGTSSLGAFSRPAVAAGVVVAAHFGTKRGPLKKWRGGIMLGASLNVIDALVSSFAPASVKGMFGLGDSGLYDRAMSDYVSMSDYIGVGAQPIDDSMTLSDYIDVQGVEQELGAMQEELGVEEDLGVLEQDLGNDRLGGVSQSSMLAPLPSASFEAPVPARSFVKRVPDATDRYDRAGSIYKGIFAGGF